MLWHRNQGIALKGIVGLIVMGGHPRRGDKYWWRWLPITRPGRHYKPVEPPEFDSRAAIPGRDDQGSRGQALKVIGELAVEGYIQAKGDPRAGWLVHLR